MRHWWPLCHEPQPPDNKRKWVGAAQIAVVCLPTRVVQRDWVHIRLYHKRSCVIVPSQSGRLVAVRALSLASIIVKIRET